MCLYYWAKFAILYRMEHYHYLKTNTIGDELKRNIYQYSNEKFWKKVNKFHYHNEKFNDLCEKMDELRAIIIKKYPFLAD